MPYKKILAIRKGQKIQTSRPKSQLINNFIDNNNNEAIYCKNACTTIFSIAIRMCYNKAKTITILNIIVHKEKDSLAHIRVENKD